MPKERSAFADHIDNNYYVGKLGLGYIYTFSGPHSTLFLSFILGLTLKRRIIVFSIAQNTHRYEIKYLNEKANLMVKFTKILFQRAKRSQIQYPVRKFCVTIEAKKIPTAHLYFDRGID
jgi:hypothetical protein